MPVLEKMEYTITVRPRASTTVTAWPAATTARAANENMCGRKAGKMERLKATTTVGDAGEAAIIIQTTTAGGYGSRAVKAAAGC